MEEQPAAEHVRFKMRFYFYFFVEHHDDVNGTLEIEEDFKLSLSQIFQLQ